MQAWESFLSRTQEVLGKELVEKWLRSLKILHFDAGNLYLEAKDPFQVSWFEEHVRPRLLKDFINNNHRPIKVHLTVLTDTPSTSRGKKKKAPVQAPLLRFLSAEIDPLLTFDQFVVDTNNELAFKLLQEQVFSPGKDLLNPFFLYGGPGVGKTHLLMATFHLLKSQGKNPFLVHAETFTEHVVSAIRGGKMQEFRSVYRSADALLIDGVDLFSGRNATQEEFFHLFNTLHTSGRQIFLTAQQPPKELKEIEPRLISRFEWGVLLSLGPLSPIKLREMVEKRIETVHLPLKASDIDFLFETFQGKHTSIQRAIEALALRRHLYRNNLKNREFGKEAPQNFDAERATIAEGQGASEHQNSEAKPTEPKPDSSGCFGIYRNNLKNREFGKKAPQNFDVEMSRAEIEEHLQDLIEAEQKDVLSEEKIVRSVAQYFGVHIEDILGDSQSREHMLPRKIAMYLCRTALQLPFSKLGKYFNRDHSTVMSSIKSIQEKIVLQEPEITKTLQRLYPSVKS